MARELILEYILGRLPDYSQEYLSSLPDDCRALYLSLQALRTQQPIISVEESGTAMRLMTALLAASITSPTELRGTARQYERPIAPLVDALRSLGARIDYLGQEGYPPLLIHPSELRTQTLEIDASMSSQYLSALMLITPLLNGQESYNLDYTRYGLSSSPYAAMTREVLRFYGIEGQQREGRISFIQRTLSTPKRGLRERDWSASSYAYELVALFPELDGLELSGLHSTSLQGDAHYVVKYFAELGVETSDAVRGIRLYRSGSPRQSEVWSIDCKGCPDLVPALVATALGLGMSFCICGVAHLRIKESDRLEALRREAQTLGFVLEIGEDRISWSGERCEVSKHPIIWSHHDHRIAMAMTPLACFIAPDGVYIEEAEVVSKSFPQYWTELERLGFALRMNDNE